VALVPTTTKEQNRRHKPISVVVVAIVNKPFRLSDKCVRKFNRLFLYILLTRFRVCARIHQKAFSKMGTTAGYQEIIAEFIEGAKQAPAQWYSIQPLGNGIPSLSDLLEVSAENLRTILKNAGLVKFGKDVKSFTFPSSKFDSFRAQYMIQDACDTTRRQMKTTKSKEWFLRLGQEYIGDLSDPGTSGRAPRVQNIRSLRKAFKDSISALAQQTSVPTNTSGEQEQEEEKECEREEDPHESDLVLLRVQRLLLPLLLKEEILQNHDF
jgi:hypothetical protein